MEYFHAFPRTRMLMDQTPIADMKFETAVAELEAIVSGMEGGQLELEASIAAHQRGMALIRHCQQQLAQAEEQIRIIENGEIRDVDRNTLENQ
jgi:exodeoxyribonuclease VII small subunit